jgi:hypothetical protein
MKAVYFLLPAALTVAFAVAYPRLRDRDLDRLWIEDQQRDLCARAAAYKPTEQDLKTPLDGAGGTEMIATPEQAAAVAERVWRKMYGEDVIDRERPFLVARGNHCWFVEGTLPRGACGGVAHVVLGADDGRVVEIYHTK